MNKLSFILTVVIAFIWIESHSQNLISVQNGNTPTFFTNLDSAIVHAQNGDTIFIPGGNYTINITISKRIHFVGAGHNPDSANSTSRTMISGNNQLILTTGADNGSVTGIYFNHINWEASYNITILQPISGYTISRCYMYKGISLPYGDNLIISENVIVRISCGGTNVIFLNNIFLGYVGINSGTVKNNVFTFSQTGGATYALSAGSCIIENNIFKPGSVAVSYYSGSSLYHNNVNGGVNGIYGDNQGSGNFLDNAELQSIFVLYDPLTANGDGIYNADFHLPANSPYKNAGRDGTDIGIYGGAFPWKEGSVPFNPHFQSSIISPTTNSTGNLPVNIKVAAQDH